MNKGAKQMKIELTQENLKELRAQFFPAGSGPLSVMRMVVKLIDSIAEDKGFDVGQNERPLK